MNGPAATLRVRRTISTPIRRAGMGSCGARNTRNRADKPCAMSTRNARLRQRILSNIEVVGDCWIWQRYLCPKGYGKCEVKGVGQLAHRIAYFAFVGPVPDGLELDHLCREPSCCNPDHLEPVTHEENMRRGYHATKTHCKRGHLLSGPNLRLMLRKGKHVRICRVCERIRVAEYQARKRAA